jgi:GNAT superfamily N-acetyltransferase
MKDFSREHEAELRNTPPRIPIRLADDDDELAILDMCRLMHREQPYHPLNIGKVAAMVRLAIHQGPERRGILGVIGERDHLRAAIFLLIEPIWYSDDWQILEFFNYVRPEYRRQAYAQDLISYAKKCSDQIGLDLTIGVFSNIRTAAKIRLYRRWVPQFGAFFCYAPPNRKPFIDRLAEMTPANKVAAE